MMNIKKYNLDYFSRKLKKTFGTAIDFYAFRKETCLSLYYFDKEKNVGDILNPYLIKNIFKLKGIKRQKGNIPHLLAIGSVMHEAKINSYIWGTGFISRTDLPKKLDPKKIKALRGKESIKLLKEKYQYDLGDIALGDPGVLMPLAYKKERKGKYKLGIIPHYVDIDKIPSSLLSDPDIKIIDVQQDPEKFVDDIMECHAIFSSSLHGLILSDAYKIPNKWIVLSDRLVGGDFKFKDYYSTTSQPEEQCSLINDKDELLNLISEFNLHVSVKEFIYSRNKLINAFPKELLGNMQ